MRAAGHSERASVLRPGCTELARLGADELAKRRHFRIGEFLIARHAVGDERAVADDLVERRGILRHRRGAKRSEEHTSELQSLMRITYAVFCLTKKPQRTTT